MPATAPVPSPRRPAHRRPHGALAAVLVVFAAVMAAVAVLAVWVDRRALDTDAWSHTAVRLADDAIVRDAVVRGLDDVVGAQLDTDAIAGVLVPDGVAPLTAAAARAVLRRAAAEALAAPAGRAALARALVQSHARAVGVLRARRPDGTALGAGRGTVVLDLRPVLEAMAGRSEATRRLVDLVPDDALALTLVESPRLADAQDAVAVIERLVVIAPPITLAFIALALLITPGHRRTTLRLAGLALLVAAALVAIARRATRGIVLDALGTPAVHRPAGERVWDITTSPLDGVAGALGLAALVVVVVSFIPWPGGTR